MPYKLGFCNLKKLGSELSSIIAYIKKRKEIKSFLEHGIFF